MHCFIKWTIQLGRAQALKCYGLRNKTCFVLLELELEMSHDQVISQSSLMIKLFVYKQVTKAVNHHYSYQSNLDFLFLDSFLQILSKQFLVIFIFDSTLLSIVQSFVCKRARLLEKEDSNKVD